MPFDQLSLLRHDGAVMLSRVFTDDQLTEHLTHCGKCSTTTAARSNRCPRCEPHRYAARYRLPRSLAPVFGKRRFAWPHALVRHMARAGDAQLADQSEAVKSYLRSCDVAADPAAFQAAAAWAAYAAPRLDLDRSAWLLDALNDRLDEAAQLQFPDASVPNDGGRFATGITPKSLAVAMAVRMSISSFCTSHQGVSYARFLQDFASF